MFNVLVVDDEAIVCEAISRFLQRSGLSIGRAETALNGFEAIDLLRMETFDLVITDIQMGGMNGIELMEVIFSEHPGIPVVVVSAHEDFKYAQQALRLGAQDYLIKPVETEHLAKVVGHVLTKRQADYLREWEQSVKQKYAVDQLITAKTFLLNEWLGDAENVWSEGELEAVFEDLGLSLPGPYYCVYHIELNWHEGEGRRNTLFDVRDRKLLLFAALNVMQETLASWESYSFFGMNSSLVNVISISDAEWLQWNQEAITQLQLLARKIQANITTYLNLDCRIGISRIQGGMEGIPKLHAQAKEAVHARGNDRRDVPIYYIGDLEQNLDQLTVKWQQQLEHLARTVQQESDPRRASLLVADLLKQLRSLSNQEEKRSSCLIQAAYCLYGLLSDYEDDQEGRTFPQEPGKFLLNAGTDGAESGYERYLTELAEYIIHGNLNREQSTIARAMEYIRKSYGNQGLKLQDVAREVHLSPNYFSYLFKKALDKNVWDYLTEVRMEEAKRLLMHSEKKRYEIAELIGYESPEHFSRVFKKYYGVSPAHFRK